MSFSEWKEYTVQELVDLNMLAKPLDGNHGGIHPKSQDYVDKGIPFIMANDLKNGKVDYSSCNFITEEQAKTLKKGFAKPGDVLLTHKATMGRTAIVDNSNEYIILTPQVTYYRVLNGIYNRYLKYYFDSNDFQDLLLNWAGSGSTRAYLGITAQLKLPIILPPIQEQKAIADTLSCLDEKIELNNRLNKTIEEMAQAIFKSWFVDFEPFQDGEFEDSEMGRIPKGWKVGTLGDIANITMGQSPKGSSYNENGDGTVFYQGRTDFGRRYPTVRLYTTEPKRTADKGDILLSVRAPVGDINVSIEDCCIGRGLASLKSKNNCISYLLYQLLNLKDSFNIYNGEGTVFGSINKDTLNNIKVLIPLDKYIKEFEFTVGKLDAIIENNSIQTKTFTAIRDSLLPKLMSGEVRVPTEEVQ